MKSKIYNIYKKLLKKYNYQGWWPLLDLHNKNNINPTKTGSLNGYHPKDYSYPKNKSQQFEIIIGSLLTQNTNWIQVEKALFNLKKINCLDPKKILTTKKELIEKSIKPTGYFKQKTERLIGLAKWFLKLKKIPTREELLQLKGVGPETADSILLYAYKIPSFVVDAYTKKIFKNKLFRENENYNNIKNIFEKNLPKKYQIYQEFHALIVEHGKRIKNK